MKTKKNSPDKTPQKIQDTLDSLSQAVQSLRDAVKIPPTEDRDIAGIIKNFEFVYELSWKALKRGLEAEGKEAWTPREVFEAAYQARWIVDPNLWPQIMKDRNLTVHTYDKTFARQMVERITRGYLAEFDRIYVLLSSRFS